MSVQFSSNDKTVIDREVETTDTDKIQEDDLSEVFEISRCVQWVKDQGLKKVALQFPDSLMQYSPRVAQLIENDLSEKYDVTICTLSYLCYLYIFLLEFTFLVIHLMGNVALTK